jgi:membrane-bound metal-dependent hydrolase YbcI (DUF457 family)
MFKGHITTSSLLGVAYGAAGAWYLDLDWGTTILAGGLTALGGMLPDLDSDSGVPVREMAGLAGAGAPFLILPRVQHLAISLEQRFVVLAAVYLLVRYGVAELFKRCTVHRGMFHSLPAMLIAGLCVFLLFPERDLRLPIYLACGVMLGFLSHLVLDEICAVDLHGLTPRLNQFAGSALKFTSSSWTATLFTYSILLALGWVVWNSNPELAGLIRPRVEGRMQHSAR